MQIFTIIIGILLMLLAVSFGIFLTCCDNAKEILLFLFLGLIVGTGGSLLMHYASNGNTSDAPQAIDVYRNKTELMYDFHNNGTYDSIVVWKGGKND